MPALDQRISQFVIAGEAIKKIAAPYNPSPSKPTCSPSMPLSKPPAGPKTTSISIFRETASVRSLSLEVRKHLDQAVSSKIAVLAPKAQSQLQQLHSVRLAIQETSKISQNNAATASSTNESAQALQSTNRSLCQTVAGLVSLSNH